MDPRLKSVLMHAAVAFVGGFGLILVKFVDVNPDPASWTLKAFEVAMAAGFFAVVKKLVAGELTGTN